MKADLFVSALYERLKRPLPGQNAQLKMSPLGRISKLTSLFKNSNPRKSGVLILIFPKEYSLFFILTQRPIYDGMHSGQICLPGGKYEKDDIDLFSTATRESMEEINADPSRIQKIGTLSELYVAPSNFSIQPFVGYTDVMPDFKKQPEEVKEIILADLFKFINNPNIGKKKIPTNRKITINAPFFEIEGYTVWGATAMILSEFLLIANESMLQYNKNQSLFAK
jgi:8-oxo-dGTP pyrophosphatase MutT (NUDIX family)